MDLENRLASIVEGEPWLLDLLGHVRARGLRDWAIAAGVIRNLVWDLAHGHVVPGSINDVDVVFFDPADRDAEPVAEERLRLLAPGLQWQVKNQAFIHELLRRKFGQVARPLSSTEEGIGTFVETATAIGVRLEADDSVTVLAPLGLEDLFELRLRMNPGAPNVELFRRRVEEKRFLERWPRLTLVEPPPG